MSRFADVVEIAGISYTGCRANLVDHYGFNSIYAGSIEWGNSGAPKAQIINRGVKGITFGLNMYSSEFGKLDSVMAAVQALEATKSPFTLVVQDGRYNLSLYVLKDYNQEHWFTEGPYSEDVAEEITFRFVSHSLYTP